MAWQAGHRRRRLRRVRWAGWLAIGLAFMGLLTETWWLNRDARRRGATPPSALAKRWARWARERGIRPGRVFGGPSSGR